MKDPNQYIEDYLLGNLSEAETKLFEQAMANDPNLAQQVATQHLIVDAFKQQQLRNKIKSNFEKIKIENKTEPIAFNWRRAAVFIGIVSSVGLAYYWNANKSNSFETAKVNDKNVSDSLANMAAAKKQDSILHQLEITENQANNQLAEVNPSRNTSRTEPESFLRGLKNKDKNHGEILAEQFFELPAPITFAAQKDSVNFYQGIKFMADKKYDAASSCFLKIDDTSTAYLHSQWYFALSLLARERYDSLLPLLQDMADDQNFIYQSKAAKLLEKVKESN
ncbi:MAG: hypothetical protein ACOYOA_14755 [Saprospiraceae bacterium]